MIVVCIALIFLFAYLFLTKDTKKRKRYFVISSGIVLFLYAALRGVLPGTDMMGYIRKYELYATYSPEQIFNIFSSDVKDPVFHVLGWCLSSIGFTHAQWWIAFIAGIYLVPAMVIIYKESPQPLTSSIMFLALGFFSFSLTGLRQTLAMGFIFLSYFYLRDKKLIKFIILVLVASLFHSTALIFLIAYPLARRKFGVIHILLFVVTVVAVVLFEGQIRTLIFVTLEDSYLGGYATKETGLNLTGFLIQGVLFLIALSYYSKTLKTYSQSIAIYNLAFLGLIFQFSAVMIAEMFRISMYFSFFNIILFPMAISTEKSWKIRFLEIAGSIMLFIIYFLRNGIPEYFFFW